MLNLDADVKWIVAIYIMATAGFAAGYLIGTKHGESRKQIVKIEPPAPAIHHDDGSVTLARVLAPPPKPLPMPPEAETRTRVAVLEVKPMTEKSEIQIDTVQMEDGSERVTVKGPAIIGGFDYPVNIRTPPVKKWTVGAGIGINNYSVIGLRSFGPVELGGLIQRDRVDRRAWDAQVFVAVRF